MKEIIFLLKINLIKMERSSSRLLSFNLKLRMTLLSQSINLLLLSQHLVPFICLKSETNFAMTGSESMTSSMKTVTTFLNPLAIFFMRQSILRMLLPDGILFLPFGLYTRVKQAAREAV